MPGKNQRGFTRPITSYLGAEGEMEEDGKGDQEEISPLDSQVTLQALSDVVARAVGKIDAEFKILRDEIGKSLDLQQGLTPN